jgi:hypothetical protein
MAEPKSKVGIIIEFDLNTEEITNIKSDFMVESYEFKDPIGYTAKLLQMALEKWVREKIGVFCPECDTPIDEGWKFCPECGWNNNNEKE